MQSKTSFFNKTVLKKDITRFAPIWCAYTLALVAGQVLLLVNGGEYRNYWPVEHMTELPGYLAIINCGYALLTAQVLFGDLYNARSCYGLHALPLRRETWYLTHLASGFLFSLVPTAVMTLMAMPIAMSSAFVNGWQIPLAVFVACNLQYVLFFGLAVFSTMCAANRIGMIAIYAVLNLGAVLLGNTVHNICTPVWMGVVVDTEPYSAYAPMAGYAAKSLFKITEDFYELSRDIRKGLNVELIIHFTHEAKSWGYYGICTLAGAVLLAVSLGLYKKRQLECAGDFVAFSCLKPVITVVASLAAGMLARLVFTGYAREQQDYYLSVALGMIVGWFVARMLLERSVRVFQLKSFRGLGILLACAAVSIGLVYLDPLGIETWVPEPDEIDSAVFGWYDSVNSLTMDSDEELAKLLRLHQLALEDRVEESEEYKNRYTENYRYRRDAREAISFSVSYRKKNGSVAVRYYSVWADSEGGRLVKHFLSQPQIVFWEVYGERVDGCARYLDIADLKIAFLNDYLLPEQYCTAQEIASLFEAMKADCEADHMAQNASLHNGYFTWTEEFDARAYPDRDPVVKSSSISLNFRGGPTSDAYSWAEIYTDSENTLKWLESRGLLEAAGITAVKTNEVYRPVYDDMDTPVAYG